MDAERIRSILERASDLLEAGKPAEALRRLRQLEHSTLDAEERIEWASLAAWALTETGRVDEALDRLEALLEEFPTSARLYGVLGVTLSEADDLDGARDALETAVELDEHDEVALANLALVYEKLRDFREAEETYEKAIRLGADIDWALQRMAAAQNELGEVDRARATLKRYLSLVPEDALQWVTLAILYSDDDAFEEAAACYKTAEALDPDSPWLRINWGVTATRAGDLAQARNQLEQLRRISPGSPRPLLLEAFILEEEENLAAAAACYERALAIQTSDESERSYALEMAMDYFARQGRADFYEKIVALAYAENVCTVELCEAYREATGQHVDEAMWYSIIVEADYRDGLIEIAQREPGKARRESRRSRRRKYTRFCRDFQVVARNPDDAVAFAMQFAERMGEKHVLVREFVNEEPIEDTHTGIYEVEPEALVFDDRAAAS